MWIFNSLRRRAPETLSLVALPVAIAIAGHAAVIGTSTVLATRTSENPTPPRVVDNSRELVRLSRRVAQSRSLAAVGLNLSDTLPPPPAPTLLDDPSKGTKDPDCSIDNDADRAEKPNRPDGQEEAAGPSRVALLPPLEIERISSLWETADPVESWPEALGAFPEDSEVREVPLKAFRPRTTKQLNALVITSADTQFLLRARDESVWIVRRSLIE